MESLATVRDLIRRDDYCCGIDLKDAYFHLAIHKEHRNKLRFQWKGKQFQYRCAPFGVTSLPRIFTKLMKNIIKVVRGWGIRIVFYLDDLLIMANSKSLVVQQTIQVIQFMMQLGLTINWKKCKLIPTQRIIFLGFNIDTHNLTFLVTPDRRKSIKQELKSVKSLTTEGQEVPIRQVARLIGKLMAIELAVFPTRLQTWALIRNLNSFRVRGWEAKMPLNQESIEEINWWMNNFQEWNGRAIFLPPPTRTLQTDASGKGWGAIFNNLEAYGPWSMAEHEFGNNVKELLAGFYGVQSFMADLQHKTILLQMDNITAVAYVNKMGGRINQLGQIAKIFWNWCIQKDIKVLAQYIPGKENLADLPSRLESDRNDWMLNPKVFQMIPVNMGPIQSRLICQQTQPSSGQFLQLASRTRSHSNRRFLAVLEKSPRMGQPSIRTYWKGIGKGTQGKMHLTIVAPIWPTQPWFPVLAEMLIDFPRLLPQMTDLYLPGFLGNELPLHQPFWNSAVWHISGEQSSSMAFQEKLLHFLQQRLRHSSGKNYEHGWRTFARWWNNQQFEDSIISPARVASFLHEMFQKNFSYSTCNGFRSAISATVEPVNGQPIGQHSLVVAVMKSIKSSIPPQPKYSESWNLDTLLQFLETQWGDNGALTLEQLRAKTVVLVRLATSCQIHRHS